MKVLMVGQLPKEAGGSYTNGVCNVVYELSKCSAKDLELFVYATNLYSKKDRGDSGTIYYETKKRYFDVFWNVVRRPFSSLNQWRYYRKVTHMSPIRCEFYKDNFERIIKEIKPDIIHCLNIIQLAPLYYANIKTKIPLVVTLHGVFFDNDKDVEDLMKGNIELADYTTGLTPETMDGIVGLGFPREKSYMIPNGTDTKKFYYSKEAREELRRQLGVEEDTRLMITVASLQKRKGQLSFCKVLKYFPESFKYRYVIIGKGEDETILRQFISDNNMAEKVQILGYVPNTDLYKYYSASDIYIHSSYEEGQALSEVEAYATGLRIAVNKDILGTIVTDTSDAFRYFVYDYECFKTNEFIKWASNENKERCSQKQYDWEKVFNMYVKAYKDIKSI